MDPAFLTLSSESPEQTARLAEGLADRLEPGDCILLSGQIGSGKTHFSRSLIRHLLLVPEDIPSPTFTLVQTYESRAGEIWHVDLYRLTSPDECAELGLTEAFDTAICLVEWPDRLGDLTPEGALHIAFSQGQAQDHRTLAFSSDRPEKWNTRIAEQADV